MTMKVLLSLFDYTGNASLPYKENGWNVIKVDTKHGIDIMTFDYKNIEADEVGIIAMIPCTCYALCGNKHKKKRLLSGEFSQAQTLVAKTKEIIDYFSSRMILKFWQVENPMSDIHKKNTWLGNIKQKFNPCDFACYDPVPENSRYNKETWLWGNFNLMTKKRIEPIEKDNPGWKNLGGKSERTKELRSITPLGFAYAFYEFNH